MRSIRSETLSPAGSKIVSAFNEAIDATRSGEPVEKKLNERDPDSSAQAARH
jgi:hypothetical protein